MNKFLTVPIRPSVGHVFDGCQVEGATYLEGQLC